MVLKRVIFLAFLNIMVWHFRFSPASRFFTQVFIQAQIKGNIKAPRHWPLCGEFTDDRGLPHTNGQLRGKCFHLMTSSRHATTLSWVIRGQFGRLHDRAADLLFFYVWDDKIQSGNGLLWCKLGQIDPHIKQEMSVLLCMVYMLIVASSHVALAE